MGTLELGPIPRSRRRPGLTTYTEDVPPRPRAGGFDTIVVSPAGGDAPYALGHLIVEGYSPGTDAILHQRVAIRDGLARQ